MAFISHNKNGSEYFGAFLVQEIINQVELFYLSKCNDLCNEKQYKDNKIEKNA